MFLIFWINYTHARIARIYERLNLRACAVRVRRSSSTVSQVWQDPKLIFAWMSVFGVVFEICLVPRRRWPALCPYPGNPAESNGRYTVNCLFEVGSFVTKTINTSIIRSCQNDDYWKTKQCSWWFEFPIEYCSITGHLYHASHFHGRPFLTLLFSSRT